MSSLIVGGAAALVAFAVCAVTILRDWPRDGFRFVLLMSSSQALLFYAATHLLNGGKTAFSPIQGLILFLVILAVVFLLAKTVIRSGSHTS